MVMRYLGARSIKLASNPIRTRLITPRPALYVPRRFAGDDIQKKDIEAGESVDANETGVIEKDDQETMLYFDHVLPFRSSIWDVRQWISYVIVSDKRPEAIQSHVMKLANPEENGSVSIPGLEITKLVPIKRDGGAFCEI